MTLSNSLEIDLEFPDVFEDLWDTTCFSGKGWRTYGAWGGRGSGKSHTIAGYLVLRAIHGYELILCAREFQRSIADSVKALIENKIHDYGLASYFYITNTEIVCRLTGAKFIFSGSHATQGNLQ